MTAEIAILNQIGVALAADSAVTISGPGNQKIYNSANKIFTLSKYQPVGIMIYGGADFMSIPWETLIKIYREELGTTGFNTLREYCDDFLKCLSKSDYFLSENMKNDYVQSVAFGYFSVILDEIIQRIEEEIDLMATDEEEYTITLISEVIGKHFDEIENHNLLPMFSDDFLGEFIACYKEDLNRVARQVFDQLPIDNELDKLTQIIAGLMTRDIFPENKSGIVIAGFGKREIYPSLYSYQIDCVVQDKLKYKEDRTVEIGNQLTASIVPFAQSEMVDMFMCGIAPELNTFYLERLEEIFNEYQENIAKEIYPDRSKQRDEIKDKLASITQQAIEKYHKIVHEQQNNDYIDPILETLQHLPKDELAVVAENLVSLTSFKRKVTMTPETVGGPIDVAIISKGDGFIWIKRKHYFNPELNMHFTANYFRGDSNGKTNEKQ